MQSEHMKSTREWLSNAHKTLLIVSSCNGTRASADVVHTRGAKGAILVSGDPAHMSGPEFSHTLSASRLCMFLKFKVHLSQLFRIKPCGTIRIQQSKLGATHAETDGQEPD